MDFRLRSGPFLALDRFERGGNHQPDGCNPPLIGHFLDLFPVLFIDSDVLVDCFFLCRFLSVLFLEKAIIRDSYGDFWKPKQRPFTGFPG